MPTSTLSGVHYAFAGFKLIAKPELRPFILLPLCLNLFLFLLIYWFSYHYFSSFTLWLAAYLPSWLLWLESLLWLLFFLIFFMLVTYTFVTLANLVGAPFNSVLAEKVEEYLSGLRLPKQTLASTLIDLPRMLGRQLSILGYYLPRAFGLLILLFIPVLQLLAAPLLFCFNAWFMALQALDCPTDNHKIPLAKVRKQLKQRYFLVFGFGLTLMLLSMIPLVNLFVVPAAVAGGTKLWLEQLREC